MEPLDFMAAVLPPPGNGRYCVVELTKKKEHVYVDNLEEAQTKLDLWRKNDYDIYFALGTFGDKNTRVRGNVQNVKCIAVDVDCNHPKDLPVFDGKVKPKAYPSAQSAVSAIINFCDEVGLSNLGSPWLVSSGGGVHAYWPLKETVSIEEWEPVAQQFKRLCFLKKLGIDQTVTADAARVLRVPNTINTGVKGDKKVREVTKVKFKNEGDYFDIEDIKALLTKNLAGTAYEMVTPSAKPSTSLVIPGTAPVGATTVKLFENSVTRFSSIMKRTVAGTGCAQLEYYAENGSEDGMEPLWRGLLSIAQKCVDANKAVIWLSDIHPYSHERMNQKLSEIKGP